MRRLLATTAAGAVVLLSGVLGVSAANAATPTPAPSATADAGPQVSVGIAPEGLGVIPAGAAAVMTVTVSNDGHAPIAAGTATIHADAKPITTRTGLNSWLTASSKTEAGTVLARIPTPTVPAGETRTLPQVTIPATSLPAPATGSIVRGLSVNLTVSGTSLASGRTVVVSYASLTHPQSNVALVMPVTTPPASDGLIPADALDAYTGPNGVLTRELDGLAADDRVAIGLDPRILASIRALGTAAPDSARRWLARLDRLPNDVFPLAYGDADVAVQAQAGLDTLLAPSSLEYGVDTANIPSQGSTVGETPVPSKTAKPASPGSKATPTPPPPPGTPTLQELLSWPYTTTGIVWPAADTVRAADLKVFAASGAKTTILSSGNVDTNGKALVSPVLTTESGTALVADAALSSALRKAETAATDDDWNAAMAAVAAQLALIDRNETGTARTILATFSRASPATADRLHDTITRFDTLPWTNPITLEEASSAAPLSDATIKDSPESAERVGAVKNLLSRESQIANFATALTNPALLTGRYRADLLTLLSVGWRSPPNDWTGAVAASMAVSQKTLNAVQVIAPASVNLLGNQANIPITVSNTLKDDLAVTVILRTTPSNGRVEIDQSVTKTIEADSRASVLVPVKARVGNGRTTLTFQIFSKTGVPIGGTPTTPVNVHADWEGLGALIIGIVVVALFGFGLVRSLLRRRASREREEADGSSEAAGRHDDATTNDQAGEDARDTAPPEGRDDEEPTREPTRPGGDPR